MKSLVKLGLGLLLMLVLLQAVSASLTDGLQVYYKADNSSAFVDALGGYNATSNSGVYNSSGKINGGYTYGASKGTRMGNVLSKVYGDNFTICYWINSPTRTDGATFGKGQNYQVAIRSNKFAYADLVDGTSVWESTQQFPVNTWNFVCVVNKLGYGNTIAYYVNGSSIAGSWVIGDGVGTFSATTHDLQVADVGTIWFGNSNAYTIDEIGMWNRSLSADEVSSLYNGGSGLSYPFGVAGENTTYTFNTFDYWNGSAISGVNISTPNGSCITAAGTCQLTTNSTFGTLSYNATLANYYQSNGTLAANGTASIQLWQGRFTVNASDLFDLSNLSGVNITIDGGSSALTNSSGVASFAGVYNGTLAFNASKSGYFSTSGSVVVNASAIVGTAQAMYNNASATKLISGSGVPYPFNLSVQGGRTYLVDGTGSAIYLRSGAVNLTLQKTGYYNRTQNYTVSALDNTSVAISSVYDAILNVTAKNILSNATVTSFNVTASNASYSYSNMTLSSSNVSSFNVEQGLTYFLLINATGYALTNTTLSVSNMTPSYRFNLYTQNSVNAYIYDESNGAPIYANITVIINGVNYSSTNYTASGNFYVDNLLDGTYDFKFSGANYSQKGYTVTVGSQSTQRLNAYLSSSTDTTIFTYQDEDSGVMLEGVGATMYRLVNSSWQVVESKTSDITGRVQFSYNQGVKYKFISTQDGYSDKIFYLDPVLFSTYTVTMKKLVSLSNAPDRTGVEIIYAPQNFAANYTGNFTFLITSPSGTLISYGLNLTYPGTPGTNYTGNNANGGQFLHQMNLTGSQGNDTVIVSYWYNSTLSGYRNYTATYHIRGLYGQNSLERLKGNSFGLGLFERVLVAILMTGVVAGVAAMMGGLMIGGTLGLLLLGFFIYIGFIPIWAAGISMVLGFVLIARKGGD